MQEEQLPTNSEIYENNRQMDFDTYFKQKLDMNKLMKNNANCYSQ